MGSALRASERKRAAKGFCSREERGQQVERLLERRESKTDLTSLPYRF